MSPSTIKSIKQSIGRAKGYLQRGHFIKALDAASVAFQLKMTTQLIGMPRMEVELALDEFCIELSNHPLIISFLAERGIKHKPFVHYKPEQEQLIFERLSALRSAMERKETETQSAHDERREKEKNTWLKLGAKCFEKKEFPRGRAYLRRVAETYGDDPGVLTKVGELMVEADILEEAVEFLKQSIEQFPRDDNAYRLLAQAYRGMKDFPKAEALYQLALKNFGSHPITLLNMGKLYAAWRKKDKAFEYAKQAFEADPSMQEAKDLMDKVG